MQKPLFFKIRILLLSILNSYLIFLDIFWGCFATVAACHRLCGKFGLQLRTAYHKLTLQQKVLHLQTNKIFCFKVSSAITFTVFKKSFATNIFAKISGFQTVLRTRQHSQLC